ncbi:uncharacterized protein BCR38DRAFT_87068 [Pseudomassariella vexata]|uniref:Uncharacterized protein n=1 Tax=Pseudomassariella vexata TaxID=1141098 RepID=A0A1Y2ED88_9PEZI|nr:uncharacterized protein BCR38DRAFT_87068 [Pseudomassariella vexata]ORY69520.1 hypothetical protein BCR38DRAFT_87068 [Pseudomassariella vexata]
MNMDHNNEIARDGVVHTKRGFNITRQKHRGLTIVNSSSAHNKSQVWSTFSKPQPPSMKFVTQKNPAGQKRRRSRTQAYNEKGPIGAHTDSDTRLASNRSHRRRAKTEVYPPKASGEAENASVVPTEEIHATCEPDLPDEGSSLLDPGKMIPSGSDHPLENSIYANMPSRVAAAHPGGSSQESILFMLACSSLCPTWDLPKILATAASPTLIKPIVLLMQHLHRMAMEGDRITEAFSARYGELCSLVGRLLNSGGESNTTQMIKIQSISFLALLAGFLGRHDDWLIHMRGLNHLVKTCGGQEALSYSLLTLIRRADLTGAFELAIEPFFEFKRCRPSVLYVLSIEERDQTSHAVYQTLSGSGISKPIIVILSYLANFINAITLAVSTMGTLNLDTEEMVEDCFFIEYSLMSFPGPMRSQELATAMIYAGDPSVCSSECGSEDSTYASAAAPATDKTSVECKTSLEIALRLTAHLYFKLLNPPYPDGIVGFVNVVKLLTKHMRTILNRMRSQALDAAIDSSLVFGSTVPNFPREASRAALIWICLSAHYMAGVYEANCCSRGASTRDWSGVHRQLLAEVVGDVELLTVGDLEMCCLFDFGRLLDQCWDVRVKIGEMLT